MGRIMCATTAATTLTRSQLSKASVRCSCWGRRCKFSRRYHSDHRTTGRLQTTRLSALGMSGARSIRTRITAKTSWSCIPLRTVDESNQGRRKMSPLIPAGLHRAIRTKWATVNHRSAVLSSSQPINPKARAQAESSSSRKSMLFIHELPIRLS